MDDAKTPKFSKKKDCFAYNIKADGCSALTHLYCVKEKCNFYKPRSAMPVTK